MQANIWTSKEIEILKNMYFSGIKKDILQPLLSNRSWDGICSKARNLGLSDKKYPNWTEEEISFLKENYKSLPTEEISSILNRTRDAIITKVNNLGISSYADKKGRYLFNRDYFSVLNLERAYWAGFIAADGCLSTVGNSIKLSIRLNRKDHNHLEMFKKCISHEGPVHKGSSLRKQTTCFFSVIEINGIFEWQSDLYKIYNITPKKSLTLKPPNLRDSSLIKAFIIGYIDGDGYIGRRHYYNYWRLSIVGTEDFLMFIESFFNKHYPYYKLAHLRKNKSIYEYDIQGKRVSTILRDLATIKVPHLYRKWNPVKNELLDKEWVEYIPDIKKEN